MRHRSYGYDAGGNYLEVYDDVNDRVGRWYGDLRQCQETPTRQVKLFPRTPDNGVDPFDLACERRYDEIVS